MNNKKLHLAHVLGASARTLTLSLSILFSGWMVGAAIAHDPFLGLPFFGKAAVPTDEEGSNGYAFSITNDGTGGSGQFVTSNSAASGEPALNASTNGSNEALIASTSGRGGVAVFESENDLAIKPTVTVKTNAPSPGLRVDSSGFGTAVEAISSGTGPAVNIRIDNTESRAAALDVSTDGSGPAARFEGDVILNGNLLGNVPVGTILPYFGSINDLTEGWVVSNGSTVDDPDSPLNGQKLPNLQGMFLRGATSQEPLGTAGGRDGFGNHSHHFSDRSSVWIPMVSGNGYATAYNPVTRASAFDNSLRNLTAPANNNNPYNTHGHMDGYASVSGRTNGAGGHDNRPRFVSVNYIIRIK